MTTEPLIPVFMTGGFMRGAAAPSQTVQAIGDTIAMRSPVPGVTAMAMSELIQQGIRQFATQVEFWTEQHLRSLQAGGFYPGKTPVELRGHAYGGLVAEMRSATERLARPDDARAFEQDDRDEQRGFPIPRTDADQDDDTARVA